MNTKHLSRGASMLALSLALSGAGVVGCTSPERKPAVEAVGALDDTRAELVAGRAQIDAVVVALADLEARPAKLEPVYNRYKNAVMAVEQRASAVGKRIQAQRAASADYRAKWQNENAQITDPALRAAADERQERVSDRYEALDRQTQALREAYDPFITQLRDLQTALANDLTYPGVQAARPTFETIRGTATRLRAQVDAAVAQLDESSQRLSPTTTPTR